MGCSAPLVALTAGELNVTRSVAGLGGVSTHVFLSNFTKVPNGGSAALFIARISESAGSTANSSARVISVGSVLTLLIVAPVTKLKETTRLGASVTNRHCPEVTTPLGPAQSLAPWPSTGTHAVNPANGAKPVPGTSCSTRIFAEVSTTSTT